MQSVSKNRDIIIELSDVVGHIYVAVYSIA